MINEGRSMQRPFGLTWWICSVGKGHCMQQHPFDELTDRHQAGVAPGGGGVDAQ